MWKYMARSATMGWSEVTVAETAALTRNWLTRIVVRLVGPSVRLCTTCTPSSRMYVMTACAALPLGFISSRYVVNGLCVLPSAKLQRVSGSTAASDA